MKKHLEAGKIVGSHGINGELRVQSWCKDSETFCTLKTLFYDELGATPVKVLRSRVHKNIVLLTLEGVDSVSKADTIRNKILYLCRDDLKLSANEYFIEDLIGLDVFDADTNEQLGKLTDVSFTGANDVYHIYSGSKKKEYLIPAIKDVVIKTDIDGGKMIIRPLRGIFDED